jgi:hypothetical protein
MHMLTGKMTSDFFTAITYSTIETNRGHPEVRDAVASSSKNNHL